uniref:Uncharacterized protein n=1 Tax=Globodera rostochiensis TaxID=31243 RepID=A0A914GYJ5_GLORO
MIWLPVSVLTLGFSASLSTDQANTAAFDCFETAPPSSNQTGGAFSHYVNCSKNCDEECYPMCIINGTKEGPDRRQMAWLCYQLRIKHKSMLEKIYSLLSDHSVTLIWLAGITVLIGLCALWVRHCSKEPRHVTVEMQIPHLQALCT